MDSRFKVSICPYATSPDIQRAIWSGQHQCVIERSTTLDEPPPSDKAGKAIIKHQLDGNRGHYSVLNMAFVKFDCSGFPHSVISQVTRHHENHFLVQSNRYTGDRFCKVARQELEVEDAFYLRPPGTYRDREGNSFEYTFAERCEDLIEFFDTCCRYESKIRRRCPYEMARGIISYDFRQEFSMSGTLKQFWHLLDQRTKKDSQLEIQCLAQLMFEALIPVCPELSEWYKTYRYGKALLSP